MAEQPKQSGTRNSRAAALLERYGGESGPTGHASAGDSGAPVSLSAFIGGKAKTARMGHLEGDGRSAPPEAAYSPGETEYRSLPGLTKPGARPLASFLEQREREVHGGQKESKTDGLAEKAEPSEVDSAKPAAEGASADASKGQGTERSKEVRSEGKDEPAAAKGKPADRSAEKAVDQFAEKPADKAAEKPDEKPADKPAEKPAEKPTDEAADKAADKPADNSAGRPADKPDERAASSQRRSTTGKRIVVLISGSGSNLQALINATSGSNPVLRDAQIVHVISNRMNAYGLKRAAATVPPIPTSVFSLKTFQNRNPGKTREDYDVALSGRVLGDGPPPDLIVLAGFMHIVSEPFLNALGHVTAASASRAARALPARPVPIINLHPALPGAFDGANAIERAFEAFQRGEVDHTGIMVHEVIAEVDRGTPVLTEKVPIHKGDTLEALQERMHCVEHRIIVDATRIVLERGGERSATTVSPASKTAAEPKLSWVAAGRSAFSADTPSASKAAEAPATGPLVARITSGGLLEPLMPTNGFYVFSDSDAVVVAGHGEDTFLWIGCHAPDAASVTGKLAGEARTRLGSKYTTVEQGTEPTAFSEYLGQPLAISRSRDAGRFPLYVVRRWNGATFVDQSECAARSLCSAFSAVADVPDRVLVWHGVGSRKAQRAAAHAWATAQASGRRVLELEESQRPRDWWDLFPEKEYASGWHHQFRGDEEDAPVLYVEADGKQGAPFTSSALRSDMVGIVDARHEVYVLVGAEARGDRKRISTALDRAEALAHTAQQARGGCTVMRPAVHVLVFPTVVPLDLAVMARRWDDAVQTAGAEKDTSKPVLMNVHSLAAARAQLARRHHATEQLANPHCLPVGVRGDM